MGITLKSGNRRPYSEAFKKYAQWNHRDSAELFVQQTRKLATELYTQTAAIAPSVARIEADVRAQGWKIPTLFKRAGDPIGRLGRGFANQWTELDIRFNRQGKRGRRSKAETAANEEQRAAAKPTLEQMQAYVIRARSAARLYLASGWLGSVLDLGGNLKKSSGGFEKKKSDYRERGGAHVKRGANSVEITLWNQTPGIETMDAKKHFVKKAHLVRTADMLAYISRKMGEAARAIF